MNSEEIRKKNLAVINRVTKLSLFTITRVVRSDEELFGSPDLTVNDVEFNRLIETMILDRIKHKASRKSYQPKMEVL